MIKLQSIIKQKNLGQYFTKRSVWLKPQIKEFIARANPSVIVDPFAGQGDLLNVVGELGYNVLGLDIDKSLGYKFNDSLNSIPKYDDGLVLTNPPYLAKNSAKRQGLKGYSYFENNEFQDLYQIAILKVLDSYKYSVFIIPETFINSSFFKKHLYNVTILEEDLFDHTDCPVCVCCFEKTTDFLKTPKYDFYKGDLHLFDSEEGNNILSSYESSVNVDISFNDKKGNLGLRGIDGLDAHDRIKFCLPEELNYSASKIKVSSRAITIIEVDFEISMNFIHTINSYLEDYRGRTHDVFLTPFKGNNRNGVRRRRLDFRLARKLINNVINEAGEGEII